MSCRIVGILQARRLSQVTVEPTVTVSGTGEDLKLSIMICALSAAVAMPQITTISPTTNTPSFVRFPARSPSPLFPSIKASFTSPAAWRTLG